MIYLIKYIVFISNVYTIYIVYMWNYKIEGKFTLNVNYR